MSRTRFIFAFICLVLVLPTAPAQEGGGRSDKELKRAAHRLHIDVEKLKNARQALREATELARSLEPLPVQHVYQLVQLWIEIDRARAAEIVESIAGDLRTAARSAKAPEAYQQATSTAYRLLAYLVGLDPEKAVELAEQWPEPAPALGEAAAKTRDNFLAQFRSDYLTTLAQSEPEKAAALLAQRAPSAGPAYSMRGQLAQRLMSSGKKEEAQRLIDQAIADFAQGKSNARFYQDFANFVQVLPRLDRERFPEAFGLLVQSSGKDTEAPGQVVQFSVGNQNFPVTSGQAAILQVFSGLFNQPELALQALDAAPDIKAKVNEIGGLDCFLNWTPRCGSRTPEAAGGTPGSGGAAPVNTGARYETAWGLVQELRGKAIRNPSLVRQKLLEAAGSSGQAYFLTHVAQVANHTDADLSVLALELARDRISEIQPLQERVGALQNLISTYRQVEGEVDSKLIKEGYVLADQIREEAAAGGVPGEATRRGRQGSPADFLEAFLTGEYAHDNFDAAIRFVRSMDNDDAKLSALLQIVQSLRNSY
ncbi:MAG: hypothetical protein DMG10_05595 [Acidobacteria bacterium]|nr:MAG: hypothetical protein DMG10_05595 [Acidobacteriota bacterium]